MNRQSTSATPSNTKTGTDKTEASHKAPRAVGRGAGAETPKTDVRDRFMAWMLTLS